MSSRPSVARAGIHEHRPVIMGPRNGVPATHSASIDARKRASAVAGCPSRGRPDRDSRASDRILHDVKQPTSFPRRVFCARVLHVGFVPTESKGGRSADRRLFVIVVAPASASVGRAGDARVASCEAAPDALAFRRSTVAVARHVPLRLRIISGNALNERDANLLIQIRSVVNRVVTL
jgi:hypothetical protein